MLIPARQRRAAPAPAKGLHLPAGLGGINAVSPPSDMAPGDYQYAFNLIPGVRGPRARGGYQEWCTGLAGATDARVRSTLPFTGGRKNGATNKLFACTSLGIYDVTDSSAAPPRVVDFPASYGDTGVGAWQVVATPGGRFGFYTDEEHGLYVYSEAAGAWEKVQAGVTQPWTGATLYAIDNQVVNGGRVYRCTAGGVSAASSTGGPAGEGPGAIADGDASWAYVGPQQARVIGPSLADQQRGLTCDPSNFVHVHVWGSRVWLVERDTTRAWYLDPLSIFGVATSFDFGMRMPHGGPLVGLFSWSYDGGSGLGTQLVALSTAGDVVIYQGTDPSSAQTFGIRGSWYVGGVPAGRRVAVDDGKDVLILSTLGLLRLSTLVAASAELEAERFESAKVGPLFAGLVATRRLQSGWALHVHPTDACLLVSYPTQEGEPVQQLARSFLGERGWWGYRGLPIESAGVVGGELFFGTPDGRVCVARGDVDALALGNPASYQPIQVSALTAPSALAGGRSVQLQLVRPVLESSTVAPEYDVRALYDWAAAEPPAPAGTGGGGEGTWDGSTWDASVWGDGAVVSRAARGVTGMGRVAALALRFNAISRTTLFGWDLAWTEGGFL